MHYILLFIAFILSTILYAVSWAPNRSTLPEESNNLYYAAVALQIVGLGMLGYYVKKISE